MKSTIAQRFYPEIAAGGFSRIDGTVQFYQRVGALVQSHHVVLDLGAGRGGAHIDDDVPYRRQLRMFRGRAAWVVGADVDAAVLENPSLDEAVLIKMGRLPISDDSVDVIFSDFTLEHISDPAQFSAEVTRVLKVGGWFCARTPNKYGYVAVASSMIPNRYHNTVLKRVQPDRMAEDVFPTYYALNTETAIVRHFPKAAWIHYVYGWNPEPAYFNQSPLLFGLVKALQALLPPLFATTLLIFSQKR